MNLRIVVTGSVPVDLPPDEAFVLFTPRGERRWVPHWSPLFLADTPDDSAPGTVFVTSSGGQRTTWIVVRRTRGRHLRYARVVQDQHAGTVDLRLEPTKRGCVVTVAYDLTALGESAGPALQRFADGYPAYLKNWEESIRALLRGESGQPKITP